MTLRSAWPLLLGGLLACEPAPTTGSDPALAGDGTGSVSFALGQGAPAGVHGVLATVACEGGFSGERYVPLEAEGLPAHVDGDLAGHAFADAFAVVPAGMCDVEVWGMADEETLAPCASASATVEIVAGQTTEVLLTLACDTAPAGGVDVEVVIDQPPVIDALVVAPGLDVPACSTAAVRVEASDPDGDDVTVDFVVKGPAGAAFTMETKGDVLLLVAETPGAYTVVATVSDGLLEASANVALTVLPGACP